jgi:hypothetical protein
MAKGTRYFEWFDPRTGTRHSFTANEDNYEERLAEVQNRNSGKRPENFPGSKRAFRGRFAADGTYTPPPRPVEETA